MGDSYLWVRDVLLRDPNWRGGIDLDGDGVIRPEETVQNYNQDNFVGDPGDWEIFAANNAEALRRRVAFFDWAQPFKADNPIHELLAIESEVAKPQEVKAAYAFAADVLKRVRERLGDGQKRSNKEKIQLVYQVIKDLGIRFVAQEDALFSGNVRGRQLDCDASSFVVLAVAHEMDWPLFAVHVPEHLFVRWEGEGERFNVDFGEVYDDVRYIQRKNISKESLTAGAYLVSQTPSQLRAGFFYNRGVAKQNLGRYAEAIEDYQKALRIDPDYARARNNLTLAQDKLEATR